MREVAEYRRYADVCQKLSREIGDLESKRQLVEMATVWTLLASERERLLENDRSIGANGEVSPSLTAKLQSPRI
jgi:hypothetical protein